MIELSHREVAPPNYPKARSEPLPATPSLGYPQEVKGVVRIRLPTPYENPSDTEFTVLCALATEQPFWLTGPQPDMDASV
jgi:hypothetical protein